jgi:hypothetical protein
VSLLPIRLPLGLPAAERSCRSPKAHRLSFAARRPRCPTVSPKTAISLIQTSVRYVAFALALVLSIVALSGAQQLQTIIGASFLAIVIGFAAQRFLTDVIAGLLMFSEGCFRNGDTVAIDVCFARAVAPTQTNHPEEVENPDSPSLGTAAGAAALFQSLFGFGSVVSVSAVVRKR